MIKSQWLSFDAILGYINVILVYEHDTSVYCDWLAEMIPSVLWEILHVSSYAAKISAEICEKYEYLYIVYMNIMQA